MDKSKKNPIEIYELFSRFSTNESIRKFLENVLWGKNPICPSFELAENQSHRIWKNKKIAGQYLCKDCRIKFTAISESKFFASSKVELRKWVYAIYLALNPNEQISSYQLAEAIDVSQKTSWRLLSKIYKISHEPSEKIYKKKK